VAIQKRFPDIFLFGLSNRLQGQLLELFTDSRLTAQIVLPNNDKSDRSDALLSGNKYLTFCPVIASTIIKRLNAYFAMC
jgi:hypothetical protein